MSSNLTEPQETASPAVGLSEEEKAAMLEASNAAKLKALEAEGELPPIDESDLPKWRVELLCPTPVILRTADYHAENATEAEVLHRRVNNLPGSIAGAMRITRLKYEGAAGEWVEDV